MVVTSHTQHLRARLQHTHNLMAENAHKKAESVRHACAGVLLPAVCVLVRNLSPRERTSLRTSGKTSPILCQSMLGIYLSISYNREAVEAHTIATYSFLVMSHRRNCKPLLQLTRTQGKEFRALASQALNAWLMMLLMRNWGSWNLLP